MTRACKFICLPNKMIDNCSPQKRTMQIKDVVDSLFSLCLLRMNELNIRNQGKNIRRVVVSIIDTQRGGIYTCRGGYIYFIVRKQTTIVYLENIYLL